MQVVKIRMKQEGTMMMILLPQLQLRTQKIKNKIKRREVKRMVKIRKKRRRNNR